MPSPHAAAVATRRATCRLGTAAWRPHAVAAHRSCCCECRAVAIGWDNARPFGTSDSRVRSGLFGFHRSAGWMITGRSPPEVSSRGWLVRFLPPVQAGYRPGLRPGPTPTAGLTQQRCGIHRPKAGMSPAAPYSSMRTEETWLTVLIGVDPHKTILITAALKFATNNTIQTIRIDATSPECRWLLVWAKRFSEQSWAVEDAWGLGRHLTQWLITHSATVTDVPSTATSRSERWNSLNYCVFRRGKCVKPKPELVPIGELLGRLSHRRQRFERARRRQPALKCIENWCCHVDR